MSTKIHTHTPRSTNTTSFARKDSFFFSSLFCLSTPTFLQRHSGPFARRNSSTGKSVPRKPSSPHTRTQSQSGSSDGLFLMTARIRGPPRKVPFAVFFCSIWRSLFPTLLDGQRFGSLGSAAGGETTHTHTNTHTHARNLCDRSVPVKEKLLTFARGAAMTRSFFGADFRQRFKTFSLKCNTLV